MPLIMSRPWKHPDSGVYWLRKAVPVDLRALVGKREEKKSLGTRDPAEARRKYPQALAEVEARWESLRNGHSPLSELRAHDLASSEYDDWLLQHRENPSRQTQWQISLGHRLWQPLIDFADPRNVMSADARAQLAAMQIDLDRMKALCATKADNLLMRHGIIAKDADRILMRKAVAQAVQRASVELDRWSRDGFVSSDVRIESSVVQSGNRRGEKKLSFEELAKGWADERKPAPKTIYEWSRVLRTLKEFLGHDDGRQVTPDDIIRWKASMVAAGLRSRTIQNAKLAPVRAIFQWGCDNRLLKENPAERINIEIKTPAAEKKRSFTDEEAQVILRAAAKQSDPVKRWVPWLGAYSGARVSELCQLRREDILEIEKIWCMKFVPEAGSLKTDGSERIVPLHPALVDGGFLDYVKSIKSGPLFKDLPPDKFGKRGGNGTKVIGRFVRALGIIDTRLSPSHSWRHRIKTQGRRHGLAQDILEAITGHGRKTVADMYGEFPVDALYRELSKIPYVL